MKEEYIKENTFRGDFVTNGKYYWRLICRMEDGTKNIVGASHRGFDTAEERDENFSFIVLSGWE